MKTEWRWKNFTADEIKCQHCGASIVVPEFLDKLQQLREDYARPMKISSWYRCSAHNASISKTGLTGPHTTGQAVDILCHGRGAYDLLHLAMLYGFTGIGINQNGPIDKRFIHIDTLKDGMGMPRIWSYGH